MLLQIQTFGAYFLATFLLYGNICNAASGSDVTQDSRERPPDASGNDGYLHFEQCSEAQIGEIEMAMKETIEILSWTNPPKLYRFAAAEYLGSHYKWKWNSYKWKISEMFRIARLLTSDWSKRRIRFVCETPIENSDGERYECDVENYACPIKVEYPPGEKSPYLTAKLTFCNKWFQYPNAKHVVSQGRTCWLSEDQEHRERTFDIRWYQSKAFWLVHAVFHIRVVNKVMTPDRYIPPGPPPAPKPPPLFADWPAHDLIAWSLNHDFQWRPVVTPMLSKLLAANMPGHDWIDPGPLANAANYALYAYAEYLTAKLGDYPDRPTTRRNDIDDTFFTGVMCPRADPNVNIDQYVPVTVDMAVAPNVKREHEKPPVLDWSDIR